MQPRDLAEGVSFRDVEAYLRDIRRRRDGYYSYTVALDDRRDNSGRLSVVLERRSNVILSKCEEHSLKVWETWPTSSCRTFAGLLLKLCYDLDEVMERRVKEDQSELPF